MARRSPRISLLKLAEYLGASVLRRRTIVRGQHEPPRLVVPQYRRVAPAALAFLRGGAVDREILQRAVQSLEGTKPASEWDERDIRNSIEALKHLAVVAPDLRLADSRVQEPGSPEQMWLAGVEISVRPHARLWRIDSQDSPVGVVKLAFSKTRAIPEREGLRAAALLHYYLDSSLDGDPARAMPELCQVVDVFHDRVFHAPPSYRRALAEAEAACEEIARVWPGATDELNPPALTLR